MPTDARWRSCFWRALASVEYWVLLAVGTAGLFQLPAALSVVGGAFALSVVSWPRARWRNVMAKARQVDTKWRDLARLAWAAGCHGQGLLYWLRGRFAMQVMAAHMANTLLHCGLAYGAGRLSGWLWGVP